MILILAGLACIALSGRAIAYIWDNEPRTLAGTVFALYGTCVLFVFGFFLFMLGMERCF